MALKILETINRNERLRKAFCAFLKNEGALQVWNFVYAPDSTGNIYERYFAPNPKIDIKLSPQLSKISKKIFESSKLDLAGLIGRFEKEIAKGRQEITKSSIEKRKLEKSNKNGKNDTKIAKLEREIEVKSSAVKNIVSDQLERKKKAKRQIDQSQFKKLLPQAVKDARKYLEGNLYVKFIKSDAFKSLRDSVTK